MTPSWGKVEPAKGGEALGALEHSAAADVSAPVRYCGALLLRQAQQAGAQQQQLQAYVLPSLPPATGGPKGAQAPRCAVPAVAAAGTGTERAAAARWAPLPRSALGPASCCRRRRCQARSRPASSPLVDPARPAYPPEILPPIVQVAAGGVAGAARLLPAAAAAASGPLQRRQPAGHDPGLCSRDQRA